MSRHASGASRQRPEPYTLAIKRSAEKALGGFSADDQDLIDDAIQALATDPRPGNSKKLAGHPPLRRLKSPPFRIIYAVDDAARTILILVVERRSDHTYHQLDRLVAGLKRGLRH